MHPSFQRREFRQRQRERGSILVICMVLAALGTIGVAAWVSLLDARGNQAEANIASLQARAAKRNGQALAYHALYANHLASSSASNSNVTYTLPDGLGECTIGAYSSVPLEQSSSLRVSRNGGTPVRSYTTDVAVTIPSSAGSENWQFQLRSYSPVLGGDLLSIHPPLEFDSSTPLVDGKLIVEGRALFWDVVEDDFSKDFQADEIILPNEILGTSKFKNSSNNNILPLNYPIVKQTTGLGGAATPYEGKIEVFDSTPNPHNSYYDRIVASGNYESFDQSSTKAKGKGPDNRPPKTTDVEAEALIATKDPKDLVDDLKKYLQLSSPVLKKVLEKDNPPFKEKELLEVLYDQDSIANDVLSELGSKHEKRINEDDIFTFHETNKTIYTNNGNGKVSIFLRRNDLPHIILRNISELRIFGQPTDAKDTEAANYPPRIILILNDSSTTETDITFYHKNSRPIVLAISSDPTAPGEVNFDFKGSGSFPEWQTVIEMRNTMGIFDTSNVSEATIVGGIRTNQPIEIDSGTLRIKPQFDPQGLEFLLSRNAWIESYRL